MFLKNRNISSKIKRSKVTDYAALIFSVQTFITFTVILLVAEQTGLSLTLMETLTTGFRGPYDQVFKVCVL